MDIRHGHSGHTGGNTITFVFHGKITNSHLFKSFCLIVMPVISVSMRQKRNSITVEVVTSFFGSLVTLLSVCRSVCYFTGKVSKLTVRVRGNYPRYNRFVAIGIAKKLSVDGPLIINPLVIPLPTFFCRMKQGNGCFVMSCLHLSFQSPFDGQPHSPPTSLPKRALLNSL